MPDAAAADTYFKLAVELQGALVSQGMFSALRQELQIARRVQATLLPKHDLVGDGYQVAGGVYPAHEVGGDFMDYFSLDDRRLAIVVGDVSGKGIPAAFFMANAKATIRGVATASLAPGATLTRVNEILAEDNAEMFFVTLLYWVLETETGRLRFANAGHPEPVLVRDDRSVLRLPSIADPALGIMTGYAYGDSEIELMSGDRLVGFTDGVSDALGTDGVAYDKGRLLVQLETAGNCGAAPTVRAILDDVIACQAGPGQLDDITAVVLRFDGRSRDRAEAVYPSGQAR